MGKDINIAYILLFLLLAGCMDYNADYSINCCSSSTADSSTTTEETTPDVEISQTTTSYQHLYGVTYGNSRFIAVGNNGKILYSDNGSSWDNGTSGITQRLNEVDYGNSKYVAVANSGKIIYSSDGITWDNATYDRTNAIYGIKYGVSRFNIVGSGYQAYSSSGSTRVSQSSGTFYDVCYGGGYFVGIGSSGDIDYSSNNGTSWSDANNVNTVNTLYGCAYGNATYIAVGASGTTVRVSTNPEDWYGGLATPTTNNIYSVIYTSSGTFVAAGYRIVMKTTDSGVNWVTQYTSLTFLDIAYGNSLYVGVTYNEKIYTSSDLTTWTKVNP